MFRRALLCILDRIYKAMEGMSSGTVYRLEGRILDELLLLVLFAPLMATDLRIPFDDYVWDTDASLARGAVLRRSAR